MKKMFLSLSVISGLIVVLASCKKSDNNSMPVPKDPNTASQASIDRFSATAGHLQVRTTANGLPAPNAAVNFDQGPFITQGLSPTGTIVQYYNFDVQPMAPAQIYAFYKNGGNTVVPGQNNVINVIPGDMGYSDFWQINKVIVPDNYVANTVTSYQEIVARGYTITQTTNIVNCPVVPRGSTATKRLPAGSDTHLTQGWYKDMVVNYFNFSEKAISVTANGQVPMIPIFVSFNINPNQPNGGPSSGFKMEMGSPQTHNVVTALPSDAGYSPLWLVAVYDNNNFSSVRDINSALAAPILIPNAGLVNCPLVSLQ